MEHKKINLFVVAFLLFSSATASSNQCDKCELSSLFSIQGSGSCLASNTGANPKLDQNTYRACAIPRDYDEFCAGDPNFCKLINPIRAAENKVHTIKRSIGVCKAFDPRRGCVDKIRYRTHIIQTRESYFCQVNAHQNCTLEHGFMGPKVKDLSLTGVEVTQSEILSCAFTDDPPCDDKCARSDDPRRGGGGAGSPGSGFPYEPVTTGGSVPVKEVPGLFSTGE